jgi:hypothetical protein
MLMMGAGCDPSDRDRRVGDDCGQSGSPYSIPRFLNGWPPFPGFDPDDPRWDMVRPGPWVNLTAVWNKAQDSYFKRTKSHWHGPLRGARKVSAKKCIALVVRDLYHGEPIRIDPDAWRGEPDFWDFDRVIAIPVDSYFLGRKKVTVLDDLHGSECIDDSALLDMIVELRNAAWLLRREEAR